MFVLKPLRGFVRALIRIAPWILRFVGFVLRVILTGAAVWVRGLTEVCREHADEWQGRVYDDGVTSDAAMWFGRVTYVIAFVVYTACLFLFAHFVVLLVFLLIQLL
jgi:hypothetical protein